MYICNCMYVLYIIQLFTRDNRDNYKKNNKNCIYVYNNYKHITLKILKIAII